MDKWKISRNKSVALSLIYAIVVGIIVCLGYNVFYFELPLPNGSVAQVLDVLDYLSNMIMMPIVAISTCIMVGWVLGPDTIINEVTKSGAKFSRKGLYIVMVKYATPILLFFLLLQSLGIL